MTAPVILQFGTGRFLRGFVDLFAHESNQRSAIPVRILAVQSTADDRIQALRNQKCCYRAHVRGIHAATIIDEVHEVSSIAEALSAKEDWHRVLEAARLPELQMIVSNTTEKGYDLDSEDDLLSSPPASFPAKLAAVLRARYSADLPPISIVPLELLPHNSARLREQVQRLIERSTDGVDFRSWVLEGCGWHSTLVDRIVTSTPASRTGVNVDSLSVTTEPYALWAIEGEPVIHVPIDHPAIRVVADVQPYFLRKVRILNAAHTALICKAMPLGFTTVKDAVDDSSIAAWLREVIFEEILPTLQDRVPDAKAFAEQTLERFRNPFHKHYLADIAFAHEEKIAIRLRPTVLEYQQKFGKPPKQLSQLAVS